MWWEDSTTALAALPFTDLYSYHHNELSFFYKLHHFLHPVITTTTPLITAVSLVYSVKAAAMSQYSQLEMQWKLCQKW
jgi:hypothetical protein